MAATDLWKDNWAEAESVDVFLHDKKFLAEMDLFLPWPRDIKSGSAGCDCKNLFGQAFGRPLVFHHSLDHVCMTKEAHVWRELVAFVEVLAGTENITTIHVSFFQTIVKNTFYCHGGHTNDLRPNKTLQCVNWTKLSQIRFWPCHENRCIITIATVPNRLSLFIPSRCKGNLSWNSHIAEVVLMFFWLFSMRGQNIC